MKGIILQLPHRKPQIGKVSSRGDLWAWFLSDGVDYKSVHRKPRKLSKKLHRLQMKGTEEHKKRSLAPQTFLDRKQAANMNFFLRKGESNPAEPRTQWSKPRIMENKS